MANYSYIAIDPRGSETRGTLEVANQSEAVRRVREMGLFPTNIKAASDRTARRTPKRPFGNTVRLRGLMPLATRRKVRAAKLVVFTRQVAPMVGAGMPLLRSLKILEEQEESGTLRRVIREIGFSIENGGSFSEAIALYPKVFNPLYVNLVRAGESAGALE